MTSPGPLCGVFNSRDWRTVTPDGQLVFLDVSSLAVAVPPPARLFAIYAGSADQLNEALYWASVNYPKFYGVNVRVIACDDGQRGPYDSAMLKALRPFDLPCLELYAYTDEMIPDAVARWHVQQGDLQARWNGSRMAVLQAYTMNGRWFASAVQEILSRGIECVNEFGIECAACFAFDRADGGQIPALADLQRQACASSPGWPPLVPVPPIPPPTNIRRILSFIYKEFRMSDVLVPQVLSSSQFNKVTGGVTVTVSNPLPASYVGLPPKGTVLPSDPAGLTGDGLVLSIQQDGSAQVRPKGMAGPFEVATEQNGLVVYHCFGGVAFPLPYCD